MVRRNALLEPGHLTVLAHPALGFPRAVEAQSQAIDSTLGQAVRGVLRRRRPARLCDPPGRSAALSARSREPAAASSCVWSTASPRKPSAKRCAPASCRRRRCCPRPGSRRKLVRPRASVRPRRRDPGLPAGPAGAGLPAPAALPADPPGPAPRASFERCSAPPPAIRPNAARTLPAPRCDAHGYNLGRGAAPPARPAARPCPRQAAAGLPADARADLRLDAAMAGLEPAARRRSRAPSCSSRRPGSPAPSPSACRAG